MTLIDYALELLDTNRSPKAVKFCLVRDLQVTKEDAESATNKALELRGKLLS